MICLKSTILALVVVFGVVVDACDPWTSCATYLVEVLDKACAVFPASARGNSSSSIDRLLPDEAKLLLPADSCFRDTRGDLSTLSCAAVGEAPTYQGYSLNYPPAADASACNIGGEEAGPDNTIDPYCEINRASLRCAMPQPGTLRYTRNMYQSLNDCESMANGTALGDIIIEPVPAWTCPEGCVCATSMNAETGEESSSADCGTDGNQGNDTDSPGYNPDDDSNASPPDQRRLIANQGSACSKSGDMYVIFHCDFIPRTGDIKALATYYADDKCTVPINSILPMAPTLGMCYERTDMGRVSYEAIERCERLDDATYEHVDIGDNGAAAELNAHLALVAMSVLAMGALGSSGSIQ